MGFRSKEPGTKSEFCHPLLGGPDKVRGTLPDHHNRYTKQLTVNAVSCLTHRMYSVVEAQVYVSALLPAGRVTFGESLSLPGP